MRRIIGMGMWMLAMGLLLLGGCNGAGATGKTGGGEPGFVVDQVQLQRSFTRFVEENSSGEEASGIEVFVELWDQYGDPIKGAGMFRFEIFHYQPAVSDPRGKRYEGAGIQEIDLSAVEINQQHWDNITLCYRMRLRAPAEAASARQVVLQVTFISGAEDQVERITDMMVLEKSD